MKDKRACLREPCAVTGAKAMFGTDDPTPEQIAEVCALRDGHAESRAKMPTGKLPLVERNWRNGPAKDRRRAPNIDAVRKHFLDLGYGAETPAQPDLMSMIEKLQAEMAELKRPAPEGVPVGNTLP